MKDSELDLFKAMLPHYFAHLKEFKNSLLARFYGVYTVKMEDIAPVSLVIMANTAQVMEKEAIRHAFDLKGSFINRKVKVTNKIKPTTTLKDLNMIDLVHLAAKSGKNSRMVTQRKDTF